MAKDFLDEVIARTHAQGPRVSSTVAEAERRRKIARQLGAIRERKELSQTVVAARMRTSTSVVSKFEAGGRRAAFDAAGGRIQTGVDPDRPNATYLLESIRFASSQRIRTPED
jgi:DNA-binding transcriptional regulator YiaG